jgi:GT2 family glycosyltransferase
LRYAALEKGHQWTWTFDDDSVPHYNTLKTLLLGIDSFNGDQSEVGILAPMPVHRTSGTVYPPLIWRDGLLRPSAELLKQPIWRADLVITSGCMVRREVVEKIGLPRADFFMDFFDFEYCLRARSHGYTIAVINGARLDHEIGDSRMIRLLGSVRLWMNQPPWREYYMTRNLSYMGWCLYPNFRTKKFVIRHLVIHAGCIALFGSRKVSCVRRMIQGFWDGIHGNLGIRFGPDNAEGRKAQDGLTSPRNAGAEEA